MVTATSPNRMHLVEGADVPAFGRARDVQVSNREDASLLARIHREGLAAMLVGIKRDLQQAMGHVEEWGATHSVLQPNGDLCGFAERLTGQLVGWASLIAAIDDQVASFGWQDGAPELQPAGEPDGRSFVDAQGRRVPLTLSEDTAVIRG